MRPILMLGAAAVALAIAAPTYAGPIDDPATDGIILAQDRTSPGSPGTTTPAQRSAEQAAQERKQRLSSAQPAAQLAVSADAIVGTEVRNTNDQKIGSVKDLVLQDGKVSAIIIARGGVLGMGTDYHQVEWSQVKMTSDMETIVLDLAEEQVKALPKMTFAKGKWNPAPVAEKKDTAPPARVAPSAPPTRTTPPAAEPPKKDDPAKKNEMKKDEAPAPKNQ